MSTQESQDPQFQDATIESTRLHHCALLRQNLLASPIYAYLLSDSKLTSSPTRGTIHLTVPLTHLHLNSRKHLHGAVSATIIDFITGLAITSWDLRESTGASVDMSISYLSTATEGDTLEVVGRSERVGGVLSFVRIEIWKVVEGGENVLVTMGQHTKYKKMQKKVEAGGVRGEDFMKNLL